MFKTVNCNGATFTVPEFLDFKCPNIPPCKPIVTKNPWNVLHERYADAIKSEQWNEQHERKWLNEVFVGLVPCGPCRERWKPISDTMDLSTAESAFTAAWQAHNRVSTLHVEPPLAEIGYKQCRELWMGPKVAFIAGNYAQHGGTETFHRTLLPRLRHFCNVIGFGATIGGGDPHSLKVPYYEGAAAIRQMAEEADIVVTWGTNQLMQLMPPGKRVIAIHHGDLASGWFTETINQKDVDEFVCVNEEVAQYIRQVRNLPVHYIPNAVDPERIKPTGKVKTRGKKICLFGHRLSEEKRPQLTVEISKHLPDDWLMVIAGDGPVKLGYLPSNVLAVGHVDNLANWLASADCFISLSTFDGFGLSMAEAHAMGVPIVATPTGIAPRIAATLLPISANAEHWAKAIVESVGKQNQSADFSVEKHAQDWVRVLS